MPARFESSGVGPQPDIEINVFDAGWRLVPELHPGPRDDIQEVVFDREEHDCIARHSVEKPDWFTAIEADARMFLDAFDFHNLPPLHLLNEHKDLEAIGLGNRAAMAQTDAFNRYALIRLQGMESVRRSDGLIKATAVLVHELSHLTMKHSYITARLDTPDELSSVHVKSGFVYADDVQGRGIFLEEAFASYMSGLYVRSKRQGWSPTTITKVPRPYVPEHYRFMDDGLDSFGGDTTMGPDGYAMEMLLWAGEQRGIMRGQEFLAQLLAARRKHTEAPAMRKIIQTINAIQPGLYTKLDRIEYDKNQWEDGCALVYEAVTGELWPDNDNTAV